mgnify:CR=1 FL=1
MATNLEPQHMIADEMLSFNDPLSPSQLFDDSNITEQSSQNTNSPTIGSDNH